MSPTPANAAPLLGEMDEAAWYEIRGHALEFMLCLKLSANSYP